MTTSKKKKIISVTTIICSIIVVIFAALQLFNVWNKALFVAEPMMGVVLLLNAYQYRYKNRTLAIILTCTGAIMFVVTGILLFI